MIIAHHIMLTGYAHWLPNDPRGSMSRMFRNPELRKLGEIHFGRKWNQPTLAQLKAFYAEARPYLKHPALWFDEAHMRAIGEAIGEVITGEKLTCYACGVMRNHLHAVVRVHRMKDTEMVRAFMQASHRALVMQRLVDPTHPVWSQDRNVRYKDNPRAVRSAIEYVHRNFVKHHLPPQNWSFTVPYDDWPFHKKRKTPAR